MNNLSEEDKKNLDKFLYDFGHEGNFRFQGLFNPRRV